MNRLSPSSAEKLRGILRKRTGRDLPDEELESAYNALMEFAMALVDMVPTQKDQLPHEKENELGHQIRTPIYFPSKQPLAKVNYLVV